MKATLFAIVFTSLYALVLPVSAQAVMQHYQLDIPRQPLDAALKDFAHQTGLQIAHFSDAINGSEQVGPIRGDLSAPQALVALLEPSGFTYKMVNDRTIAVVRITADDARAPSSSDSRSNIAGSSGGSRQGQLRLSQAAPGGAGASTAAPSQPAAEQLDLGEVVVTALHRSERLQDVPASVSAVNAADLASMGATGYEDYLNTVPGVSFSDSGIRSRVSIRGISSPVDADPPIGATTAIYLDDAPVTELEAQSFDPTVYDVDRVEVLRGPQGTLYGASSMGGTVRVILNKPKLNAFEASADASVGSIAHGGTDYRGDAVANLPIVSDMLAARVSAGFQNNGGFIDDVGVGGPDTNRRDRTSARGALLFDPTQDTSIYLNAMYQRDTWTGLPDANLTAPYYESDQLFRQNGWSEAHLYGLTINQDFHWSTLVSASNYLEHDSYNNEDATNLFAPILVAITGIPIAANQGVGAGNHIPYHVFTQEIRFASEGTNRVDWLVGGYYSTSSSVFNQSFPVSQLPAYAALFTADDVYNSVETTHRHQLAGFGEATFHVTSRWALTAGLRYSNLGESYKNVTSGFLNGGTTSIAAGANNKPLTRKFMTQYNLTPDNMLYAQAAQGFREGSGVAPVPDNICGADLHALGLNAPPSQYNPDRLWSYEIGSKNTFGDKRYSINAAAYYIDWKDIQQSIQLPTCFFTLIANAGRAVSQGLELEGTARPVTGLTLGANFSYSDATLKSYPLAGPAYDGNQLPLSAKWQGGATAAYDFELHGIDFFASASASYVGGRWNTLEGAGAAASLMPGYTNSSLRFGIRRDHWEAAIYSTNLLDQRIVIYRDMLLQHEVLGEPRVIGLSFKVKN